MNYKLQKIGFVSGLFLLIVVINFGCNARSNKVLETGSAEITLKDAFKDYFYFGTAIDTFQSRGKDPKATSVINKQFNSVVAENCMKSMYLQPEKDTFFFDDADDFVAFGEANNMFIIGHTLIWHSQAPKWFFIDELGNQVSRDTLIARMKKHITTVVARYKGRVDGWDVVNEAFNDDGTYRKSKFYEIIGEDYLKLAFQFAHQADPDAELYYNDYSMPKPGKRNAVAQMVKEFKTEGLRIDAIGMQGHYTLTYPTVNEFEETVEDFIASGCKVMVTELDITVLPLVSNNVSADISKNYKSDPKLNPYPESLPDSMQAALANRYADLFKVLVAHSESVSRVTVWGVNDKQTWRNNWPVKGRTDYPLLFDRNNEAKPVVDTLLTICKKYATAIQKTECAPLAHD